MSVWLCIPSKRPPEEARRVLDLWAERGYKIALWCDDPKDATAKDPDFAHVEGYRGYAAAANGLIQRVMILDESADWFIVAGDDVEPDLNHTAAEIARECGHHFGCLQDRPNFEASTYGVMQPTGDRWGDEPWSRQKWPDAPAYIDRVLGSAWYGREYCRRMYGGKGPLWPEYYHMHSDEESQNVALKMGVLWQRRDLIQYHHHAMRESNPTPDFLKRAYSSEHWKESEALFKRRQSLGFPGHEPLP